jgi:hypothetical protein
MPNACSPGGIDERALRVVHSRRRRRDQQRSFDSIERAGERLGLLHIPLHDLDIGKITDGSRLGGVAHQRPNLDALTGNLPHRRLTVVSRCARNQNHGCSFVEEFLSPALRISKFATDLAKARDPRWNGSDCLHDNRRSAATSSSIDLSSSD